MGKYRLIKGFEYKDAIVTAIKNAEKSVFIVMFDWRWNEHDPAEHMQQINNELVRAKARGVVVRAIVRKDEIHKKLREVGIKSVNLKTRGYLHSKAVLVDRKELFIGSHNFTTRALETNIETTLATTEEEPCADFDDYFTTLWHSKKR